VRSSSLSILGTPRLSTLLRRGAVADNRKPITEADFLTRLVDRIELLTGLIEFC
jgi:hypothetical protein